LVLSKQPTTLRYRVNSKPTVLSRAAEMMWRLPCCFGIANLLDPRYLLRSVLFHEVSETESPFTKGLDVTITPSDLEKTLKFLVSHYSPVGLDDVLGAFSGGSLPPRPLLVTFDDGYASACDFAAPLCHKFGVPAISFVNAACLDNRQLALDNLICYVANVLGMGTVNAAARAVDGTTDLELHSLADVFAGFLPSISLSSSKAFREELVHLTGINEGDLAGEAGLYMTSQQVRNLQAFAFEIGNHTYSHVNCRCLVGEGFSQEIDRNKTTLEEISGRKVRSFSVPYGSSADLTADVVAHLEESGHTSVFLVESLANQRSDRVPLYRVSIKAAGDATLFSEIEVLPRLRGIRNRLFGAKILALHSGSAQWVQ
jgi:peptidoglycan/xylan/chitin deacetylase (PgdA/CDA1 family)